MTMMGLDLVEKEALMMYHTQKGLKDSQDLGNSDGEESSEFKECDEELSDWQESSESDREG